MTRASLARPGLVLVLLVMLLALGGCKDERYVFRNVPFCVADEPGVLPMLEDYRLVVEYDDGISVQSMGQGMSSANDIGWVDDDEVIVALVKCKGPELVPFDLDDLADELTESWVPMICPGQELVFHTTLTATSDPTTKGLGLDGVFLFPKVDLECKAGRMIQEEKYTLGQIVEDVMDHVEAFHTKHGRMPTTWAEVQSSTLAEPLFDDPWGRPVVFTAKDGKVTITSLGPDGQPATADDVEVLAMTATQSTHILTFDAAGVVMWPSRRYADMAKEAETIKKVLEQTGGAK